MGFNFNDNSIYIVPNSLKMKLLDILANSNKIYNITFISLEELEKHFTLTDKSDERIKARRIMERIKQLTIDMELISENRRS